MEKSLRINNRIRIPEVQVIDSEGKQLGTMPTRAALEMAEEQGLDLVEVSPHARPPIAKIMDYGKYMYQKEKQEKSATKQKDQDMKTVRIGFKTGDHDLKFKSGQIDKFLKQGHPVRVEVFLRGRERALAHLGREKLESFIKVISEPYIIQNPVKRSPRGWALVIKPEKSK